MGSYNETTRRLGMLSQPADQKTSPNEKGQDKMGWLERNLAIIQILLLAFALLISFILTLINITSGLQYGLIVTLLLLLCIQFILYSRNYLEKIKSNSERISITTSGLSESSDKSLEHLERLKVDANNILNAVSIQNPDRLPPIEDAVKAKKCIFISGTNMSFINENREKFVEVDASVEIIFAVSDSDKPNIKPFLIQSYGKRENDLASKKGQFIEAVKDINEQRKECGKREAQILWLNLFVPIAYMAVDYNDRDEPLGFQIIHAKHYLLNNKIDTKTPAINLSFRPGTETYKKHLKQIELIKKHGANLANRLERQGS